MRFLFLFSLLIATPLSAEPPRVVTTVAPLYGIVADLMRGIGEPASIVTAGMDPHHFSLKPSQIFTLNDADILFAIGGEMEPWLPRLLPGIKGEIVYLADIPSLYDLLLPLRELADIGNDHGHGEIDAFDPHMWLDPVFGREWVLYAAAALAELDAENAEIYNSNAQNAITSIDVAALRLQLVAEKLTDVVFVTSHDSLQYLENRFDLQITGALSSAAGEQTGARNLGELKRIPSNVCLLIDTSGNSTDYANLFPDWPKVRFDPLGHELAGQPDYLANLYLSLAAALENCITDP